MAKIGLNNFRVGTNLGGQPLREHLPFGEHDDAGYIDPLLKASKIGRDCLNVAEEFILNNNWADATELALWRKNTLLQIEEAIATTQREPAPDPGKEDWCALASRHLIDGFLNE